MDIVTRKLAATERQEARMRASGASGSQITIPFPHDSLDPHLDVARRLAVALGYDERAVHQTGETELMLMWTVDPFFDPED